MGSTQLEYAEKRMKQKWFDLVMAEQKGASVPALERMYNAYTLAVEEDQMASSGDCDQLRLRDLAVQALSGFDWCLLIFFSPDNQRRLAGCCQIRRDRVGIIGNQQADMLEEHLFAQLAVPGIDMA